jgi:hypothetical protein
VVHHRSHVLLTVWPLAVLFALGLAHTWPALGGGPAYAAASPISWPSLVARAVVVVVFLGVYVRGWSLLRLDSPDDAGPYHSTGSLRLQKLAGGFAWGLLLGHVCVEWVIAMRVGPVALSQYELLRSFLSRPAVVVFYTFGIAALGLFLSQGFAATFRAWGVGARPETSRWLELGCTLASAMLMLMAVNLLSHFATGRAYWSPLEPATSARATQEAPR